jgi:hypothetical protein
VHNWFRGGPLIRFVRLVDDSLPALPDQSGADQLRRLWRCALDAGPSGSRCGSTATSLRATWIIAADVADGVEPRVDALDALDQLLTEPDSVRADSEV